MTDLPKREAIDPSLASSCGGDDLPPRDAVERGGPSMETSRSETPEARLRFAFVLERLENSFRYAVVALCMGLTALAAKEFWPASPPLAAGVADAAAGAGGKTLQRAPLDGASTGWRDPPAPAPPSHEGSAFPELPPVPPVHVDRAAFSTLPGDGTPAAASLAPARVVPAEAPPRRVRPSSRRTPARAVSRKRPKGLLEGLIEELRTIPHHARARRRG
jgi:hypothetical protein